MLHRRWEPEGAQEAWGAAACPLLCTDQPKPHQIGEDWPRPGWASQRVIIQVAFSFASARCQPAMTCLLWISPLLKTFEVLSVPHSTAEIVASVTRRSMCLLALAIFIQFPFWAALACAQSPTSAIKEFGLIGTWADDCNANPGPSNQYASFSITSRGTIMLRNDFGPDYGDMIYRIVAGIRPSCTYLLPSAPRDDQIRILSLAFSMTVSSAT
jgi:hypothetical protein